MPIKQSNSAQTYITQLAAALKERGVKDVEDILADYQDYFAQSKAKGYSDAESIRRLPSPEELAASYNESSEVRQSQESTSQPSSAQRITIFGITIAGDILLLPVLFIAVLLLACFFIVGVSLVTTGPLLFIPDSVLGQVDVVSPPSLQVIPTALLFISAGIALAGMSIAACERIYSGYRASIVVRRWLLTGRHSDHIKLVPSVSKRLRALLYKMTLFAGVAAVMLLLVIAAISLLSDGTVNFPSTWKM